MDRWDGYVARTQHVPKSASVNRRRDPLEEIYAVWVDCFLVPWAKEDHVPCACTLDTRWLYKCVYHRIEVNRMYIYNYIFIYLSIKRPKLDQWYRTYLRLPTNTKVNRRDPRPSSYGWLEQTFSPSSTQGLISRQRIGSEGENVGRRINKIIITETNTECGNRAG